MKLHKFDDKRPGETVTVKFTFTRELAAGETLTGSPALTVSVRLGADPAPEALLAGAPVLGTDHVLVAITGGLDGCQYLLSCLADTSAGNRLQLDAILPVAHPR